VFFLFSVDVEGSSAGWTVDVEGSSAGWTVDVEGPLAGWTVDVEGSSARWTVDVEGPLAGIGVFFQLRMGVRERLSKRNLGTVRVGTFGLGGIRVKGMPFGLGGRVGKGMPPELPATEFPSSEEPATGITGRTGAQLTTEVAMMICAIVWKGCIFMEGV
jgi:hypothetical protein